MTSIVAKPTVQTKDQKYYQKHKNKILEKLNAYVKCECGQYTTQSNIYNHLKSKRHANLMKKNHNYAYCEECKTFVKNITIHKYTKKHNKNK